MSSWFKKPLNIGIAIGAAVLAVVAVVLIIWGVTHHREGGLLEVCWSDGGRAAYVDTSQLEIGEVVNGPCERPEELVWPREQIPLTLATLSAESRPLAADTDEVRVLQQAVTDLNRELGFELFRVGAGLQSTDAEVRFGGAFEGEGSPPPGYVAHVRAGGIIRGFIYIRSDVAAVDRTLFLVLKHELLHLAGLEHDDFTLSLMFPITREDWNLESMSLAHTTDSDVASLQRLYRPQE